LVDRCNAPRIKNLLLISAKILFYILNVLRESKSKTNVMNYFLLIEDSEGDISGIVFEESFLTVMSNKKMGK